MSLIKFNYGTQSNSREAIIDLILFGRKTKRHTKIYKHTVSIECGRISLFNQVLPGGASVRDIINTFQLTKGD